MVDKKQVEQWLKEGTITENQAQKMLVDVSEYRKEESSSKFIIAISTIGAVLLGIGVVLFVASNWNAIPSILKVVFLLGSTISVYYLGYRFKYQKQTYTRVGASLIFLASLLFGATIFLVGQIYHINANSHVLVLIWLVGIIPLVYVFENKPIAGLSCLLFYIWISLFVFRGVIFWEASGNFFSLPVLYLVSGILLFGIGGLHYLSDGLKDIARIYRVAGIRICMLSIFLLTFRFFSGHYGEFNIREGTQISNQFIAGFVVFSVLAIIFSVINLFFKPSKSDISVLEGSISLGLLAVSLIFYFFPSSTNIYVVLFNLILAGVVLFLIYIGYDREDMRLVNIGMFYLSVLVIVRYFDFFWGLFPRSVFFVVGGLVLVLGGIALEKKRRQLKERFGG